MDNKLNVRISFKSGKIMNMVSNDYSTKEFRNWISRNFQKADGSSYEFVIFNNTFVNVGEIEYIEQIN